MITQGHTRFIKYVTVPTGNRREPRTHHALVRERGITLCGLATYAMKKEAVTFLPLPVSCYKCEVQLRKHWPVKGGFFAG